MDDDAALIKSLDVIAPGAPWPQDAVDLGKVLSLLPADAAAQAGYFHGLKSYVARHPPSLA